MMIDLAENGSEKFTPLKTIAERQGLSLKYVGRIIPELSNAGLLEGVQGRGGGYRLCRLPSECAASISSSRRTAPPPMEKNPSSASASP